MVGGLAEEEDAYGGVRGPLEEEATAGIGEGLAAQAEGLRQPEDDAASWATWLAGLGSALSASDVRLLEALQEVLTASTAAGRARAVADVEAAGVDVPEDLDDEGLAAWVADTAASVLAQVNETSATQASALVQRELDRPAEERDFNGLWLAVLALFGLSRAELIGVTETNRGLNHGWLALLGQALGEITMETEPPRHPRCRCWLRVQRRPGGSTGSPSGSTGSPSGWQVLWLTTLDERVCPLCGPLHGMEVGGTR